MSRLSDDNLKKKKKSRSCPLQISALKTCHQDILKIIIASSFIRGQLTEDE